MRKIGELLFTLLFVVIGVYLLWSGAKMKRVCTEVTEGIVVDIEKELSSDNTSDSAKYTYYPVVQYTVGGRDITKKSSNGTTNFKYYKGDKITINYDPNDVEKFIIKGDNTILIIGIVFIILGSITSVGIAISLFKN